MKRLLIDLDICSKCGECDMLCSYIQHPGNNGITSLREFGHFAIVCRRCDDAPCVGSCPWEAIELQKDTNMVKRYMMRCTSCKSCSRACPFGVIYPETIPFVIARCDFCLGRLKEGEHPICLESCSHGGIKYGEFEEKKEEGIFKASEYLLIKTSYKWERVLEMPAKK
jgi:Fe-S-cluster-containing dehydrogenase component